MTFFLMTFFATFFGAILGPILIIFSGPQIHFFQLFNNNRRHQNTITPLYKALSSKCAPDAQNVPKRFPKCSQNAPLSVPKRPLKASSSVPLRAFFATMPIRHLEAYAASWFAGLVGIGGASTMNSR